MTNPQGATPDMCECGTCGYQWRRGQDGSHHCSVFLRAKLTAAESALAEAKAGEEALLICIQTACEELGGQVQPAFLPDLIRERLAKLQSDLAAAQRDAGRYRTKRSIDHDRLKTTVAYELANDDERAMMEAAWFLSYDAAIDAALSAGEQK